MALNTSELQRIKYELGFNQLSVGAEPYVGITRYFEQIVLPNLNAGALTTSATAVVAGGPTAISLTLSSAFGFNMFDHVVVDVDYATEHATVQAVTGSSIVVSLFKAHGGAGPYPVAVEGGESIVREALSKCRMIAALIEQWGPRAGIKKADEVEFFGGAGGRGGKEPSGFKTLEDMQSYFRGELCKLLFGVGSIQQFGGGGSRIGVY